jgi:hypothetical protein
LTKLGTKEVWIGRRIIDKTGAFRRSQFYYAAKSFFFCISCHLLSAILLLKRTDRLDGKSGNVVRTVDVSHRLGSENERDCIVNLSNFVLVNSLHLLMIDGLIVV